MDRLKSLLGVATFSAVLCLIALGCGAPPPEPVQPQPPPPPIVETRVVPPQPTRPVDYLPPTEEWVHMPAQILYPSGGSRLDDTARAMLREAHASMAARPDIVRIRVEGHADGQGNREANMRLGEERAQGVVDFLVGELGLPRELFEIVSFGDERPLTSESERRDLELNRRVEFSLLVRRRAAMVR